MKITDSRFVIVTNRRAGVGYFLRAFGDVRTVEWIALRIYEHKGVALGAGSHRQQSLRHA